MAIYYTKRKQNPKKPVVSNETKAFFVKIFSILIYLLVFFLFFIIAASSEGPTYSVRSNHNNHPS